MVLSFFVGGRCRLNGLCQGTAAHRNRAHIQRLHTLPKRGVVDGQWTLQEPAAGERHQPHPVCPRLCRQIQCRQLGAGQPVRCDILCQHALGGIDRHDNIQPAELGLFPIESPLRTGQCEDQEDERENQRGIAPGQAPKRHPDREPFQQAWRDECRHEAPPLAQRPPEKRRQQGSQQQQPQKMGVGELHGSLRKIVWPRSTSSSSNASPGVTAQANSSSCLVYFLMSASVFSS